MLQTSSKRQTIFFFFRSNDGHSSLCQYQESLQRVCNENPLPAPGEGYDAASEKCRVEVVLVYTKCMTTGNNVT